MKCSQQSDRIERIVLPGHNMMATANLACPNRAFSQCAVFLYFLSITIIFFFHFTLYSTWVLSSPTSGYILF